MHRCSRPRAVTRRPARARPADPARRSALTLALLLSFGALAGCGSRDGGDVVLPDNVAPSLDGQPAAVADGPADLEAVAITSASVALAWQPARIAVDGYEIRRDGAPIGTSVGPRFLDAGALSGTRRYEIAGREVDAVAGIDRSTVVIELEVEVPEPSTLATLRGGRPLLPSASGAAPLTVLLDARDRVALGGREGDLYAVERRDLDGNVLARRLLPGLDAQLLLAGRDAWFVIGDADERRPITALNPDTLEILWTLESTALDLSGGCRFAALLADGSLSCRGFADDTLRIAADGVAGTPAAGARIPTGTRLSADDGVTLIDVWALPAATVPNRFFPVYEWVVRDVFAGSAEDRGALFEDDPAIDFPLTVEALGVFDREVVVAGHVLANGCLRVCTEVLPIPPYVDGHYVARLDRDSGRVLALERLPFGQPLGSGAARVEGDTLTFTGRDTLARLDVLSLSVLERREIAGEPLALSDTSVLVRVNGASLPDASTGTGAVGAPRWFSFAR